MPRLSPYLLIKTKDSIRSVSATASLPVRLGNATQMSLFMCPAGEGILGHRFLDLEWKTDRFFPW